MSNTTSVALVHGAASSIGRELVAGLVEQQVRVVLYDECAGEDACRELVRSMDGSEDLLKVLPQTAKSDEIVPSAVQIHERLDYLFNCVVPTKNTSECYLLQYPQKLYQRALAAAEAMVACHSPGAIVNQFFLGSLHEGTFLESAVLMGKGAITGLTRQICCRYGKSGIRINTIQAGLTTFPENEGLILERILSRKPPVGRWATPLEIAKFMLFLALRNGYMTGQAICFDGGLTAGNTGT